MTENSGLAGARGGTAFPVPIHLRRCHYGLGLRLRRQIRCAEEPAPIRDGLVLAGATSSS
jgi:hypothetical protein